MSEYVFKLPDLGEGTVEAEIAEWMVKVGDSVNEEDTICAMLTDKAAVELTAPVSGTVVKVAGEVGDTIAVGSALVVFATDSSAAPDDTLDATAATPAAADQKESQDSNRKPVAQAQPAASADQQRVKTSPSIRMRAREAGVDLNQVPGSGPGGRILKSDFDAWLESTGPSGQLASTERQKAVGSTEIKVIGLRRKIAQRMEAANREVPHFAYVEEIDVTAVESLRQHLNAKKPADQPGLTLLPFISLALIRALRAFPQCNAHYDSERNVLIQHHGVHLGIATQTPDGLKVPVVRHAEALSLQQLAEQIRQAAAGARDNTAGRETLAGSTITLTSLGKLGGVVSTPIINLPEVAIIGVNKAMDRPTVQNGHMVIRRMMNLSSSFDHRFVDGHDAASMIQQMKGMLEQPATLFMAD